jgi:hypothetical protein
MAEERSELSAVKSIAYDFGAAGVAAGALICENTAPSCDTIVA